jgi:lysophospholipase L1-like esterase
MLPGAATYFQRGTAVYVDVIAAGNDSSGEVRVDAKPNTSPTQTFFVPITSTHTSSMGLEGRPGEILTQRLGPFLFGGRDYMQVELSGTDAAKFTDIVGARIVSAVDPRGWVIQSVSAGGYTSASLLANHAACGPVLAAVEPDLAILAYGANDCASGTGQTTAQYHTNLVNLIAFLRQHLGARFPVILIADPWRVLTNPTFQDALDRYPGVCYDIARQDPYVCALNSRRLLDAIGWNASGQSTFLTDTVHYSALGAITKARVEVQRLQLAFGSGACTADVDDGTGTGVMDGGVTIDDLLYFLGLYEAGTPGADVDDGGGTGVPDGGVTIDDLLYFLARFENGC